MSEGEDRLPYNVGVRKIPYDDRDNVRGVTDDPDREFRDLMNADDDSRVRVGSHTAYQVMLTETEAAELLASGESSGPGNNVRYVEEDVVCEPHYAWNDGALTIPTPETKNYMRWGSVDLSALHATDVVIAVLDQGTTKAVRDYMGFQLLGRTTTGDALPSGQELFTDASDPTGFQNHGCLVAPNCVPPGGKFFDVIICNADGKGPASNFLAGVKYACDNGARLLNYSFGSPPGTAMSSTYTDAFTYANNVGAQIFISMGNDSTAGMGMPAIGSRTYANVVSVINFNEATDVRSTSSNYDADATGCAPGNLVTSLNPDGSRTTWSGTSAAAPHTCMMAARLCTGGAFTPAQAVAALKATRRDTGQAAAQQGGGAFDLAAAAANLLNTPIARGPGNVTPTVVGVTGAGSNGGTVSFSGGNVSGLTTDDLRLVFLFTSAGARPVAPIGWRQLTSLGDSTSRVTIFAKYYSPEDALTNVFLNSVGGVSNYATGFVCVALRAAGGIDLNKIVPQVQFGTGTAVTSPQVAPRTTNPLILELFSQREADASAAGTLALPTGLTQQGFYRVSGGQAGLASYRTLVTSMTPGSGARTARYTSTSDASGSWCSVALEIPASLAVAAAVPNPALIGNLIDTFSGALATNFPTINGAAINNNALAVNAITNAGATVYSAAKTAANYTLVNSGCFAEILGVPAVAGTDTANAQMWIADSAPAATVDRLGWEYVAKTNSLVARSQSGNNYATTDYATLTYSAVTHRWWRILHNGTQVLFQTSPDGLAWTTQATVANPPTWVAKTTLILSFEAFRTTGTNDTFRVDNVNSPPVPTDALGTFWAVSNA